MSRKTPATVYFGYELGRAREEAGLSLEEVGREVGYAPGTIRAYESGERFPQPNLVAWADQRFGTNRFRTIYDTLLKKDAYPESFRPWIDIEQEATAIRSYELALIPGLLQTEDYADALLDGDEARVAARIQRQAILEREPPQFVALIHEVALRQLVGGAEVMRAQLHKLAEAATRHLIQVVPWTVGTYKCLDGSFVLATMDGSDVIYLPTARGGYILDSPEAVEGVRWRWDTIRAEALPRQQSKELILRLAEGHD